MKKCIDLISSTVMSLLACLTFVISQRPRFLGPRDTFAGRPRFRACGVAVSAVPPGSSGVRCALRIGHCEPLGPIIIHAALALGLQVVSTGGGPLAQEPAAADAYHRPGCKLGSMAAGGSGAGGGGRAASRSPRRFRRFLTKLWCCITPTTIIIPCYRGEIRVNASSGDFAILREWRCKERSSPLVKSMRNGMSQHNADLPSSVARTLLETPSKYCF